MYRVLKYAWDNIIVDMVLMPAVKVALFAAFIAKSYEIVNESNK